MPVGMHRPKPSKWKNVWPFLAILVIVPALGWVAATALYRGQTTNVSVHPVPATSSSAQAPATRGASPGAAAPSAAPSVEPTPSSSPSSSAASAEPDHGAVISVLNGTETQGFAAQKVTILNDAGYAGTSAANADANWTNTTSTVFYEDPKMEATAKDIASKLGIDTVRQQSGLGNPDVVIVLR